MGNEENGWFTAVLLVMVLVMSSMPLFKTSIAITPPTTAIYLKQQKIIVRHENQTGAYGYVTGHVIIQASYDEEAVSYYAKLTVSSPFNSSKIPILVFSPSVSRQDFTFSIIVPFNTSKDEPHIVTVNGSYGSDPEHLNMTLSPVTCIMYIAQYYSWNVSCPDKVKMRAGNAKKVLLNATNTGNDHDKMRIVIMNIDEYYERGWEFQISMVKHYTSAGSSLSIPLIIEVPEDERPGTYEMDLVYISSLAESVGERSHGGDHTLKVEVLNNYKDEIISGVYIIIPMALILMLALIIVLVKRRIGK